MRTEPAQSRDRGDSRVRFAFLTPIAPSKQRGPPGPARPKTDGAPLAKQGTIGRVHMDSVGYVNVRPQPTECVAVLDGSRSGTDVVQLQLEAESGGDCGEGSCPAEHPFGLVRCLREVRVQA